MTVTRSPRPPAPEAADRPGAAGRRARWGLAAGAALVVVAVLVPVVTGVDVRAGTAAPLLGDWALRVAPSSVVALAVVGLVGWPGLPRLVGSMPWRRLLGLSWVTSATWMVALALVDGRAGLGRVLDHGTEYLQSARAVDSVAELLRTYVSRIPFDAPDRLAEHLAGHPPGAVLPFVGLDRLGLGSWQAAGVVVVAVAATVPAAVAVTLDRLGAREAARTALPFLVVGPSAVLMAVSADALFTALVAWSLAVLAAAVGAASRGRRLALAVPAGLLLGWCLMSSYGFVLVAPLALAVLVAGRGDLRARVGVGAVAAGGALVVVLAFAAAGFAWWEAFPVLQERYWSGIASTRPAWYWLFGNLAALVLCAGPVLPAAVASGLPGEAGLRWGPRGRPLGRQWARVVAADPVRALVLSAVAVVVVADLSLMSKAEVERIWLPFVPWLLLSVVWLPPAWRRGGLVGQAVAAVVVQHAVRTVW
ncbi:MAG: hypothetical protein ACRCYR_11555 [Phycicoccus sp.]